MPSLNHGDHTDETLVYLVRNKLKPMDDRRAALEALLERYQRKLIAGVNKLYNRNQFLSAVMCRSVEDFCGDALYKAIMGFRSGRGAKFSTFLYLVFRNEVISGKRRPRPPQPATDAEGKDLLDARPGPALQPGSPTHLAFLEALDLARACIRAMNERYQTAFFFGVVLNFSPAELQVTLPGESGDNAKQIKHRAIAEFVRLWIEKGGEKTEHLLQAAAGAVAGRVDTEKIRDARARQAYLLWAQKGSLVAVARKMKIKTDELRKLLRTALKDLFEQGMMRGTRPADLALHLELSEGGKPADHVLERVNRTLDVVRAAFGFAPPERATHSLGTFVQSRLSREEDYESACRELGLKPAMLRKLLVDEYEPEKAFFTRLSAFLDVPADQLRALPRRPAGDTRLLLRSRPAFDGERFRLRVLACLDS